MFLALLLLSADVSLPEASLHRQNAAVEKQRESVRKQVPPGTSSFFTTGWFDSRAPITAAAPAVEAPCEAVPADQLRKLIVEASTRNSVNPLLLRAIIDRESGGRPCAVSPKGAQGLMQLMPATASELGVTDPFDPDQNLDAGSRYLRQMLARYKGDLRLALAAYNAGPQRVDEAKAVPSLPETQAYVDRILEAIKAVDSAPE